ncbi:MAG: PilZ domain-containing protein [Candidatus Omnitrophica bacterium]|nr:PilZ domain-containing protein [Candidatus Omnitrophota bacterium]
MSKLRVSTREIGSVYVFDLEGSPTQETVQEVAWKIQRSIRRHRLQRIILNLQLVPSLDHLGLRKLIAACIRPRQSLIYGVSQTLANFLEETYLPQNVRVCNDEKDVTEDFGPFLLEKEKEKEIGTSNGEEKQDTIGYKLERRRSKRMHVAIPLELRIFSEGHEPLVTHAIATNISEGGLFAEYLDLETAQKLEDFNSLVGTRLEIRIFPSANFPEEYQLEGAVVRKELRKKQLGLAVKFLAS